MKIWVAEDETSLSDLIYEHLEPQVGEENIKIFPNGRALLEEMAKTGDRPDIVLTDYSMPEMSGDELIRVLRATFRTIRVVCMTALPDYGDMAMELGAEAVINKPFSLFDLDSVLGL